MKNIIRDIKVNKIALKKQFVEYINEKFDGTLHLTDIGLEGILFKTIEYETMDIVEITVEKISAYGDEVFVEGVNNYETPIELSSTQLGGDNFIALIEEILYC